MTIKKEKIYMVVLDRMGTLNRRRDVFFLHTVFFFLEIGQKVEHV